MGDIRGLARPGRNRAEARDDEKLRGAGPFRRSRIAVGQQGGKTRLLMVLEWTRDMDEVDVARLHGFRPRLDATEAGEQALGAK